jgi:hypothetical protein
VTSAAAQGMKFKAQSRDVPGLLRRAALISVLCTLYLFTAACTGDFDQRVEQARRINPGGTASGTLANPDGSVFIRGAVSMAGVVRNAGVVLRPVRSDGSVDWDDANILGNGITFNNGIYQVTMNDRRYRGAILVEVRARTGFDSEGASPATAVSRKFHPMGPEHFLYTVVPAFEGYASVDNHVTPLTTVAVLRGKAFDGSVAGVQGGVSAGMFGLMARQVAEFFAIPRVRSTMPQDFAASGGLESNDDLQAYVLAALSQIAKDLGVTNVWDFWLAMALDASDDGELNGSIGFIPNTGVLMPDLGQGNLVGRALHDGYLDPNNLERRISKNNTNMVPGGALEQLIAALDLPRDINALTTFEYNLTLRLPDSLTIAAGETYQTRIINVELLPDGVRFEPYGDSAGPGFVEYVWTTPAGISVSDFGLISVTAGTPAGSYQVSLTIQPAAGQSFVAGETIAHEISVRVP